MSKNIVIGILGVAVVVVGGFFLLKSKPPVDSVTDNNPNNNAQNSTPNTPANTPPASTPSLTLGAPTLQTNPQASVSSSTAFVTGQVNPNGVSTTYWFDYGENAAVTSRTTSQQIGSGFFSTYSPAYIAGLRANTLYYFRLSANNNFGTVNGATYSFTTNNNPPVLGVAPAVHTNNAGNVLQTTANFNGTVNPNGFQTNYWFEYGKDTSFGSVTAQNVVASGNSAVSVAMAVSGLDPVTKYYFRINGQNQYGTVNGATLNFTTKGPANPTAPSVSTTSASNIVQTSAVLNGNVNPNGAATTYWFEYSTDSLLGTLIGNGTSEQTVASGNSNVSVKTNVNDLNKDTKYYYRLVGKNSVGTVKGGIMSFRTKN